MMRYYYTSNRKANIKHSIPTTNKECITTGTLHRLLVGMETGTTTPKNGFALFCKVNRTSGLSNPAFGNVSQKNENICSQKNLYMDIYNHSISNRSELKTNPMSYNRKTNQMSYSR